MINAETVLDSVKRRWIFILVITAVCLGLAVASSISSDGEEVVNKTYTAQASVYVSANEKSEGEASYNYEVDDDRLMTDARRVVVSHSVAGEVRETLGEEVTIASPFWINTKSNTNFYTRFIFVSASAPTTELAIEAANLAAEKTVDVLNTMPTVSEAYVSDWAALAATGSRAADFGADPFVVESDPIVVASSAISMKKLVVYGLVGLVGSVFLFAAFDILTRKARSAADVERLLGVPVIASVKDPRAVGSLVDDVRSIMAKHDFRSIAIVGGVEGDRANEIADALCTEGVFVSDTIVVADDMGAATKLIDAGCALVVLAYGKSSGKDIDLVESKLRLTGAPVIGAVFIGK